MSKHRKKNTLLFFPLFVEQTFPIAIKTMADEDVDCPPNDEDDPPMSTRKRRRESSGAEEGISAKRSPVCLPGTIEEVVALQKKPSKQLMGHSLTESLSLRVLNAALQLQWEHLRERSRNGGKAKTPGIHGTVCNLFGLSTHSHSKIMPSFFQGNGRGHKSRPRGNCDGSVCHMSSAKAMERLLREFVRTKRKQQNRVTACQVLDHLLEEGCIVVPIDDSGKHKKEGVCDSTQECPSMVRKAQLQTRSSQR